MIESGKYDVLRDEYRLNNKIPLYISITTDKKIIIQDLRPYYDEKETLRWYDDYLQSNDMNFENKKIKKIAYLPVEISSWTILID
jgi:hypothetical protein